MYTIFNGQNNYIFRYIYNMKGFGFPGKPTGPGSSPTPSYRADTSKQKQ